MPACLLLALAAFACEPARAIQGAAGGMVRVPGGRFTMGANLEPPGDESPSHTIVLPTFWIDRYEVTNLRYHQCVEAGACSEPQDLRFFDDPQAGDLPVVYVTWYEAGAHCSWLKKRLPSEAEWEGAARGAKALAYPWGNDASPEKLSAGLRFNGPVRVGSFPQGAGPYGALDMAGNVWEWTADWYLPYAGSAFHSDLFGEKYKVVRGGSWNHSVEDARTFHRDIAHPARALAVVGFRCAADSPPGSP
jgi:formylglycine-generating enzyme required for sulfatase activity